MESPSTSVLLVEDNLPDCRLLRTLLAERESTRFEVTDTGRLVAALDQIRRRRFDVILADLSLPDSQGLNTFSQLHQAAPNIPILVLSGLDDDTVAIQAVRSGAQDYLVKGKVDGYSLSRAISYAIERDRVEQALQQSEKHHRHLLESVTDYCFTVPLEDGKPRKGVHGPGCVTVTGYTTADYDKDPDLWLRMVHEEDRTAVVDQVLRVLAGEMPPPREHRILHRDGQVRWVRTKVVPRRDQDGKLTAYDGLIADITERKRAEEKLVASEVFYHSLVENLPQNIFRKDINERFTFANQRFCTMLGKSLEEIKGKTDFDFFPPDLAAKYQKDDRTVMRSGETFETIEENQAPSGEKIYVNVVKTPIHDAHGEIIGIQGIFWDITERKRFEEKLQRANAELARSEAALRKSHAELKAAQAQLIQAEKMESVGTLAAGVAHEVKNPLAIMMMGINFLTKRMPADDENVSLVLKEMRDAIARADSITRGLLDFSASRQLTVAPQDLNALMEATLQLVRHELNKSQIRVVREYADQLPSVAVDRNQIQQVFVNVFVNAIHAMPSGGTLTLRSYVKRLTETTHFEGSRKADHFWVGDMALIVEVEDTGTGISDQYLAKIFDPFFTTKPTGVGTGLGLPVSKKIIELHGGTIDIKNAKKGGVRVTIMLKPQAQRESP